jgi:hypothetical protein
MPDSQTLNVQPRNATHTQNKQKHPFFTQDNVVFPVNVTIHGNEHCKDEVTFILKKKLFTHAINKNIGNENSYCIQKLYPNTCTSLSQLWLAFTPVRAQNMFGCSLSATQRQEKDTTRKVTLSNMNKINR